MIAGLYALAAARITDTCPAVLQAVTGMDAEAALEMMALGPDVSALVHPIGDTATPVRNAGLVVSQEVRHRFGATLAMVFPGGFDQFEPARDQVIAALRGWAPPGASMPVEYAGGQTLQYDAARDGGRWLHLLQFTVTSQETYEHQS